MNQHTEPRWRQPLRALLRSAKIRVPTIEVNRVALLSQPPGDALPGFVVVERVGAVDAGVEQGAHLGAELEVEPVAR